MIAFYISQRLQPEPIYEALAHQDGLDLPRPALRDSGRRMSVNAAIREAPEPLRADLELRRALLLVGGSSLDAWPVENGDGFLGMVRCRDIAAEVEAGRGTLPVGALLTSPDETPNADAFAHVHGDEPLGQVLARMGETQRTVLPVVSRANARLLLGLVTLPDILRTFGVDRADQVPAVEVVDD
jgi:predicted transcriptional regulator